MPELIEVFEAVRGSAIITKKYARRVTANYVWLGSDEASPGLKRRGAAICYFRTWIGAADWLIDEATRSERSARLKHEAALGTLQDIQAAVDRAKSDWRVEDARRAAPKAAAK